MQPSLSVIEISNNDSIFILSRIGNKSTSDMFLDGKFALIYTISRKCRLMFVCLYKMDTSLQNNDIGDRE